MPRADSLYILAAGHSGSTLLNLILGSHSRAVAVSELTNLPVNIARNEVCTCGQALHDCAFWRAVAAQIESQRGIDILEEPTRFDLGYIDAPRGPYRGPPAYRAAWKLRRIALYASIVTGVPLPAFMRHRFDRGMRNRLALYDAVRAVSGASVVVDASKEYLQGVTLQRWRPTQAQLILLVRDGRAVFYSNLKRGFGRAVSLDSWLNYWRNTLAVVTAGADPARVRTLHYENLAADPEKQVRAVCDFAGLDYEPGMLDIGSKQHHVTSGNNMRFNKSGIRLDTKWREELAAADLAFFEKHAGALNRRLGYE